MVLGKTAPQGSAEISEATLGLSPFNSNNLPIVSSFSRSKNDVDDYIVVFAEIGDLKLDCSLQWRAVHLVAGASVGAYST